MIEICAWCQRDDQRLTILDGTPVDKALLALEMSGDIVDDDDMVLSHGICPSHVTQQLALLEAKK